ncbi:class I SAM-dependent methyltransferase [Neisseriaceae bacterium JH1-16]|nr:class I SAM-dependent methyltransferase [Neisseriaceae bacterium JH1-16]
MLSPKLLADLHSLWLEGEQHDAATQERRERRLNITPDTGHLLYQLARSSQARRIVEIGTSNGYSTLWLALAARANQGLVQTLDILAEKQRQAAANLARFDLSKQVELICTDALAWLTDAPLYSADLVFLDAERTLYPAYWPHLQRILSPGALLVMDNAQSHPDECRPFVTEVLATPGYLAETYAIGKGQLVILKDC